MPSSTARINTRLAPGRSSGSPHTPGPHRRMAPNPRRFTVVSPPRVRLPPGQFVRSRFGFRVAILRSCLERILEVLYAAGLRSLGPVVGAGEEGFGNREADRFRGFDVDDQLELGRLHPILQACTKTVGPSPSTLQPLVAGWQFIGLCREARRDEAGREGAHTQHNAHSYGL